MANTAPQTEVRNLLFIDDEPNIINSLKMLFRKQPNTQLFLTTDQTEALDIIKNNQIHVIVSDMKMPNMFGSELLAKVKEISPNTMRILLSGYSDIEDILDSINEAQIFRFIPKPWDNNDIKKKINDAANTSALFWQESIESADDGYVSKKEVLYIGQPEPGSSIFNEIRNHPNVIVHQAKNAQQAMVELFNKKNISVMILHAESYTRNLSNGHSHYRNLVALAKLLKSSHPTLISIIIAEDNDSDNAIKLINEAQIFRYLTEPLDEDVLHHSINDAIEYANILENTPILTKKHQVEKMSEEIPEEILHEKGSFFNRLFSLFKKK